MQIFLEMSLMDHSIDQKSPFITQLKDILHPMGITARNQENKIKEEPVDYDEVPVENKRPQKERTNITTGTANQPQQEIQKVNHLERQKQITKTQMTMNSEGWLGAAKNKEHFTNYPPSFSETDLRHSNGLDNTSNKGSSSKVSPSPALSPGVTNERLSTN